MAGPFEATATSRSSIWRRAAFGVGGKLQWAFSIAAGLTAISTVVSLLCFSAVEAGLAEFCRSADADRGQCDAALGHLRGNLGGRRPLDQCQDRRRSKGHRRIDCAQARRSGRRLAAAGKARQRQPGGRQAGHVVAAAQRQSLGAGRHHHRTQRSAHANRQARRHAASNPRAAASSGWRNCRIRGRRSKSPPRRISS